MRQLDGTQSHTEAAIPRAFAYQRLADSPQAQATRSKFEQLAQTKLDLPSETIRQFGVAMNTGDRLGDAYIDAAFATRAGKARPRKDVEQALRGGIGSVTDPAPELLAMFKEINTEPGWLDWNTVEHGAEVFRRYGKELYPYFGMITFGGYAIRTINRPLALTGAYTGNSAFSRFLETCRLWTDTTEPSALRPGGAGRRSAVMVRVLHSIIRHTLLPHPEWDREELGVPISQLGMFQTLIASSHYPGQQLKLLGYRPTDDDIVAMMHHWRYVGYLMGAEPPWWPETAADGFRAQLLTMFSEEPDFGPDSENLCRSFMNTFLPPKDAGGLRRIWGSLKYQAQLGHSIFYLGPDLHKASGLPDPGLWRYAPLARVFPNFARETARRRIPGAAGWIDQVHRMARQEFLRKNLEGGEAKFQPVDKLTR
jgi:mpaB/rubber oxygenase-like protein